jgi:hypothetical protein
MADSKFIPRQFFRNDLDFGVPEKDLLWKERSNWPNGATEDWARAAWLQHHLAQSMRAQIKTRFATLATFAEIAGMKPARLGRILRGDYIMRLEDIGLAERLLGLNVRLVEGSPNVGP